MDAYETMIHPDQAIGTASLLGDINVIGSTNEWEAIRTMLFQPIVLNGPESLVNKFTANSTNPTQGPRPGVYIRAVFRQLVTNYKYDNATDTSYDSLDQESFPFDYIDLKLIPQSRIIPASNGLYAVPNTGPGFGIAAQGAAELVDSWLQITIRRVMCPNIPLQTLAALKNKINGAPYQPACFGVPGLNLNVPQTTANPEFGDELVITGLKPYQQTFPIQTLRFDDALWEKKVIQSCIDQDKSTPTNIVILTDENGLPTTQPMTWWNGTLLFSWRTVLDNWYSVSYVPGNTTPIHLASYGWVGWNCDWLPGGIGVTLQVAGGFNPLHRYPSGWYELASWQGMALHGNLQPYNFFNLGNIYLQRKYWNDTDIRLRGGNGSGTYNGGWSNPGTVSLNADQLLLLQTLSGPSNTVDGANKCLPMDLLFRNDAQ